MSTPAKLVAPMWQSIGLLLLASRMIAAGPCEELATFGTPTVAITGAVVVAAGNFTELGGKPISGLPSFCRVSATLHPSADSAIRIELWMPEQNWNGRLEGTGNGGFAGNLAYGALVAGLKRGYAVVNTDMGMATAAGKDASVFINRPERWKDWGYRSTHEMTVQAKRLVTAFYKRPPAHNYFVGCSTGGEQAWMEAQRYPDDYDGIVGGAPANNRTGVHESILWNFVSTERTPQSRIPVAKLRTLAKAVMNACDEMDGVADGIIADPQRCAFDLGSIQCSGLETDECLTLQQVETARRLYAGPVNPHSGKQLYPGLPKGSELAWDRLGPAENGQPPFAPIFEWVFGREWDWRSFDFDRLVSAVDKKLAPMVNATNLNLEAFRKRGHKLLIYHGWADWLVPPGESVRYREAIASASPGDDLSRFYRLFMVPGMDHCSGGAGPDHFDALTAMVGWVERDEAPDRIIASQFAPGEESGKPLRTRPLCPYPQVARYNGHGNSDEEASYSCVTAAK